MSAQPHDSFSARGNGNGSGNGYYRTSETATGSRDASIGQLLRQLLKEGGAMVTNEVALAKSEARETMQTTREGATAIGSGGAVAMSGFIILLLGAVYGLGLLMPVWLAALIVGAVVSFAGLAMVQAGRRKFHSDSLRPEHTLNSLRKDGNVIRRRTHDHH